MALSPGESTEVGAEVSSKLACHRGGRPASRVHLPLCSQCPLSLLRLWRHPSPTPCSRLKRGLGHIVLSRVNEILTGSVAPGLLICYCAGSWTERVLANHWHSLNVQVGPRNEINTRDVDLREDNWISSTAFEPWLKACLKPTTPLDSVQFIQTNTFFSFLFLSYLPPSLLSLSLFLLSSLSPFFSLCLFHSRPALLMPPISWLSQFGLRFLLLTTEGILTDIETL